jgi:hypothetical protein
MRLSFGAAAYRMGLLLPLVFLAAATSAAASTSRSVSGRVAAEKAVQAFRFRGKTGELELRDTLKTSCSFRHFRADVTLAGASSGTYGLTGARQPYPMRLTEKFSISGIKASFSFPVGVGFASSGNTLTHEADASSGHDLGFSYRQSPLHFSALAITSVSHSATLEIDVGGVWTLVAQTSWHKGTGFC